MLREKERSDLCTVVWKLTIKYNKGNHTINQSSGEASNNNKHEIHGIIGTRTSRSYPVDNNTIMDNTNSNKNNNLSNSSTSKNDNNN